MKNKSNNLNCPTCESSNINKNFVDDRNMYECEKCKHIWYSFRKTTNGYFTNIDDITEVVESNGEHEIDIEILLNMIFKENFENDLSFEEQLDNWAKKNKLVYEIIKTKHSNKVRFWR